MNSRVEIDENGRFLIEIPENIVEELALDQGERVEWVENEGMVELYFG